MFTNTEATHFLKSLFEDAMANAKIDLMQNFFHHDVIGHFNKEILGIKDLEDRIQQIKLHTLSSDYKVGAVIIIDDLIAFQCDTRHINIKDKSFHKSQISAIYRIKDRKVSEFWIIPSSSDSSFKNHTQEYMAYMNKFKISKKLKNLFMENLHQAEQLHLGKHNKLSQSDRECIFYYLNGFSSKDTAIEMSLSYRTVEIYLARIKERFGCSNKRELNEKIFPRK